MLTGLCFYYKYLKLQLQTPDMKLKLYSAASLLAIAGLALVITTSIVASIFYQQRQREKATADLARFYLRQAHQAVDRDGGCRGADVSVHARGAARRGAGVRRPDDRGRHRGQGSGRDHAHDRAGARS